MHLRKTLATAAAAMALAACGSVGIAQAGPLFPPTMADSPFLQPVQINFYFWGGHKYCWYDGGWQGPGWYWCGYPWRTGYGWGGGWGWHGWVGGHSAGWYRGHPGFRGGGVHGAGGVRAGFVGGGGHGGGGHGGHGGGGHRGGGHRGGGHRR